MNNLIKRTEILLLDGRNDQESARISELLGSHGYHVRVIDDWLNQTDPLELYDADLVLFFMQDPNSSRDSFARYLFDREDERTLRSIAIVTDNSAETIKVALDIASDFLSFPLNPTELASKVALQLRRKKIGLALSSRLRQVQSEYYQLSRSLLDLDRTQNYDRETGLAGHQLAYSYLEEAITAARQNNGTVNLLLLEVELISDNSHQMSAAVREQCLAKIITEINKLLTNCDLVGRVSQDRVLVVFEGPFSSEALAYYQSSVYDWSADTQLNDIEFRLVSSTATFPMHGGTIDLLLRHLDDSLIVNALTDGIGAVFDPVINLDNKESNYRALIELDIKKARERGEFSLYFQPQVDAVTHKITGCEVLLRWQHPSLGFISPDYFIPILEQNGMMGVIGAWVVEESINQHLSWISKGLDPIRIAVNFSIRQLADPSLGDWLESLPVASQIHAPWFELEVTETATTSNFEVVKTNLSKARELGMQVAVDDFGTGNATLSYLQHLPVDVIKIDRQFILNVLDSEQDAALLRAIVGLASALGKDVIAEGVETLDHARFLTGAGCKELQGYYFGRPMPADDFACLLSSSKSGNDQSARGTDSSLFAR